MSATTLRMYAFYAEPRALILGGTAVFGQVSLVIDGCRVVITEVRAGVLDLAELLGRYVEAIAGVKDGWRVDLYALHIAYPARYLDSVLYFMRRYGVQRRFLRIVLGDPRVVPIKAEGIDGVVRNVAYLHAVKHVIASTVGSPGPGRMSPTIHRVLLESGYNADEGLAMRRGGAVPCKVELR
ncbi:hypothetical protein [Vulcanisaeta sp. JCM 14467]